MDTSVPKETVGGGRILQLLQMQEAFCRPTPRDGPAYSFSRLRPLLSESSIRLRARAGCVNDLATAITGILKKQPRPRVASSLQNRAHPPSLQIEPPRRANVRAGYRGSSISGLRASLKSARPATLRPSLEVGPNFPVEPARSHGQPAAAETAHATSAPVAVPCRSPAHTETSSALGRKVHPPDRSQEQTLKSSPVAQTLTLAMRVIDGYLGVLDE